MTDKTLFLLQADFAATPQALLKLQQLYGAKDAVVLLGDSVLYVDDTSLAQYSQLYILEHDEELLADSLPDPIQKIDYLQFADLVLQYTRCVSLK